MNRRLLYAQLCEEIAYGWPTPWWPQDRDAAMCATAGLTCVKTQALDRYVDIVACVVQEANCGQG